MEWFRSGAELTLFQTFASQEALVAQLRDVWICGGLSLRLARSCKRVGTTVYGSDDLRVHALMGDAFTRAPHGVAPEVAPDQRGLQAARGPSSTTGSRRG